MPAITGLRPVTDADAEGLIALVGAAYADYPGCVLDLDGLDGDLRAPATAVADRGGSWWVVEDGGRVVATAGAGPPRDERVELKRLYVAHSHRRQGLAAALVELVHDHARGLGATRVELWSDTRFTDAHRLYERLGYRRDGDRRELGDPSGTTENRFEISLRP